MENSYSSQRVSEFLWIKMGTPWLGVWVFQKLKQKIKSPLSILWGNSPWTQSPLPKASKTQDTSTQRKIALFAINWGLKGQWRKLKLNFAFISVSKLRGFFFFLDWILLALQNSEQVLGFDFFTGDWGMSGVYTQWLFYSNEGLAPCLFFALWARWSLPFLSFLAFFF